MAETLRKELKRPDQFVTTGKRWLEWGVQNQRTLIAAGIGVLVVLVAIGGMYSYREANERQANAELAAALNAFDSGEWPEAASRLREVADRWGGSIAAVARVFAARADIESGDLDGAAATLEKALETGLPASYLRQQALYNLAFVSESRGDAEAAADRYAEASALSGPYTGPAILAEARLREKSGAADRAKELYRRYLGENPDAPDSAEIEKRIGEL